MSSAETPPVERPKRLSLSQILELVLTRGASERSVVGLTRNAAGETQIDVRVSTGTDGEAATIEDAERKALEVYERLVAKYPPRTGHENATVELTRNAKGETQIEVSLRTTDGGARTADAATIQAMAIYDTVRGRYPMSDGNSAKPGSVKGSE